LTMSAVGEISGVTNEPAGDGAFTVTITDNATPPLTTEVDIAFTISDPPNPRSYEQQLIISSARHHSSNGDHLIDEFVEITNVSDGPIDLAGMSLSDFASGDTRDRAIKYGVEVDTSFHFEIPAADRSRRPSVLPPGGTARIWVSEPCGTTFTIGETEVATQAVGHGGLATLEYSLVEANWHRLDLHADELWLRTSAGDVEDFVRWHSADTPAGSAPEWS